ncbi:DMT family transporter [Alloyangia pacifica]|uniref:Transporter family-2 protein n=1 Tax=Alloyangia pacifica TaxID=311180 RepID=A0A1I6RMS9_9RHOB|nr:DMT family transporter [Alloyangia pacifica]SDG53400.1 transporter family-2 protein [Alloyangia pacifica]SFS65992.1 transporter family-2 protein [Alloyangia pacifica]
MAASTTISEGPRRPHPLEICAALCAGALLTLMLLSNGMMAAHTTPIFASLTAHGVGSVVAALLLLVFWIRWPARRRGASGRAPIWAYLGGISGALTVIISTVVVNSSLALTGTMALGLAGQVVLALLFDCFGALGLERRLPRRNDLLALASIIVGTLLIIFARGNAG